MSRPIPLHATSGTLPRSNVRYRVVQWPTLADQLDRWYRERRMVLGDRGPEEAG